MTHSVADEGLACAKVVVGGVTTGVVFGVATMVVNGVSTGVVFGVTTMVVTGVTSRAVFGGTVGVGGAKVSNFSPGKVVLL